MKFSILHKTDYHYQYPARDSHTELRLRPRTTDQQQVHAFRLTITPRARVREYRDYYGNCVASFSLPHAHDFLSIVAEAEVETVAPLRPRLPSGPLAVKMLQDPSFRDFHAEFLAPSHYIPLRQPVMEVAADLLDAAGNDLTALMEGVLEFMHREFTYEAGVTNVHDDIEAVFRGRRGVCQDYAHVVIGIARAAGIPARYVSGYLQVPWTETLASHAWAELFVPGHGWWGIDATGSGPLSDRYIVLGWGRDYADVVPVRGIVRGGGRQQLHVEVQIQEMQAQQ